MKILSNDEFSSQVMLSDNPPPAVVNLEDKTENFCVLASYEGAVMVSKWEAMEVARLITAHYAMQLS